MSLKQTRVAEDDDASEDEYRHHYDDEDEYDQRLAQEIKGWNLFRDFPVKKESASMATSDYIEFSVKILKLFSYIIVFLAVLGSSVVTKGTLLFITTQFKKGREISHCNKALAFDKQFITILPLEERIAWLWAVLIVFGAPELEVFLRSVRMCLFKKVNKPTIPQFAVAFVIETLQTIGVATLLLVVLPELDVLKGAMLMNAVCFIPGLLNAFSRDSSEPRYIVKILLDVLSTSAQATAFVVWPLVDGSPILWSIVIGCALTSLGWWENFVKYIDEHTSLPILYLCILKKRLKETRYHTQMILSLWRIVVFIFCIMVSLALQGDDAFSFFTHTRDAFGERNYTAREFQITQTSVTGVEFVLPIHWQSVLWVALIQVVSAYFCYLSSVFACKILIQKFSFMFALSLAGPVAINLLISFCGLRNADPCAFRGTIPDYLFFEIPPVYYLKDYVGREMTWVWLLWLASQCWITAHAWAPRCERLAAIDKLFAKPGYLGPLIDQSLLLNRTTDEKEYELEDEKLCKDGDNISFTGSIKTAKDVKPSDSISRIYACATMWHESKEEMKDFLKSIFRLDEDQSARRVAQKYLGITDKDYYELEVHIFMDDAFEKPKRNKDKNKSKMDNEVPQKEVKVNGFVKSLVETVDKAASEVHLTNVRLRPPKKYPTPYGGRLEWTMPGKNILVCHLKDKSKIRHKKRWSQVMYMYYFLGHRLMDTPLSVDRKEKIAENTYLLALDGDIDFKPSAATLLIDLMKKNKNLGAACGRIHPVGSGFMTWYQKFEYAIGHWLQKATEHMIGCVLCSPGCFSLFRGKALMDDNIMKKYTLTSAEAQHFVQHDQGEDRWLCTLLLQRGYRVEYSAASDAYTHCPDSFDEFYNQRRRWVPSTTANILDLLTNYKRTVQANENISTLYIVYQCILMAGTVLGPGTIFLMMIGAMNAIIKTSIGNALLINLVPVLLFLVVCMTCKAKHQLFLAAVITCIYAMVMLVVLMGIALQIVEDGWLAPSSIFTIAVFGMFFVTAALHPQEFFCLIYIVVYYITIPSMYILLIIYSVCNLNDVTWGTREVAEDETEQEEEAKSKAAENKKKDKGVLQWFDKQGDETSGTLECGVAGLFRCICCSNPQDHKEDLHLLQISTALDKMQKRLDALGAPPETVKTVSRRQSSITFRADALETVYENGDSENSTEIPWEERDDLVNPYWIEDPALMKGEVDYLPTAEIVFWGDLIEAYLKPIDEDLEKKERIEKDLKDLRDKMVFAFVMLNAMFVLVIFLLQLNQDQLHFNWPLGQRVNISYDAPSNIVLIERAYLQLEPLGFLFLVFFGIIMVIQFIAMLFHRFGTLAHLLSTCKLSWYCTKKPEDLTEDALMEKRGVNIAKDLQKLNSDDIEQREDDTNVSKRKVVQNIEKSRGDKQSDINLQTNFRRRLEILQAAKEDQAPRLPSLGVRQSTRRATLRAIQTRRDSIMAEKRLSRSQSGRNSAMSSYDRPASLREMAMMQSMSGAHVNKGYEPALDSDDESTTERKTTVRLK